MNSKFEKWNELPPELRYECVKRMDFKSRMLLRATSQTEKFIVESSRKIHFDSVKIDIGYYTRVICKENSMETVKIEQRVCKNTPELKQMSYHLVAQILKFAVIEDFDLRTKFGNYDDIEASEFISTIAKVPPMEFKTLQLDIQNLEVIQTLLKKCKKTEKLVLDGYGFGMNYGFGLGECQMIDFSGLQSFFTAKTLQIRRLDTPVVPFLLIQKWIQDDVELGTTLQVCFKRQNFFDFLAEQLGCMVIYESDTEIRLRTDNPAKHILLRVIPDNYVSFLVIPADQKASEYEKNDQWAKDIYMYEIDCSMRQRDMLFHFPPPANLNS